MFIPKYTITNQILKNIASLDASKEVILSSHLPGTWEEKLRRQAKADTVYNSLILTGTFITEEDVENILSEKANETNLPTGRQVKNFSKALDSISELASQVENQSFSLTDQTILSLHKTLTSGVISEGYSGKLRVRQIAIRDARTGEFIYSPPPAAEVEYLIDDLLNFLNSKNGKETHPAVKAGIMHFEIYRIHPFVEGNLLLGVLFSLLLLYLEDYSVRGFLSFAQYINLTQVEYFELLQKTAKQEALDTFDRDMTEWLDYFIKGLSTELGSLKERVKKLSGESTLKGALGEVVTLTERQMVIMDYLRKNHSMRNKDFRKLFPDFSDDTVILELKGLRKRGLVKKEGGTKNAVYVLG